MPYWKNKRLYPKTGEKLQIDGFMTTISSTPPLGTGHVIFEHCGQKMSIDLGIFPEVFRYEFESQCWLVGNPEGFRTNCILTEGHKPTLHLRSTS